MPELDVTDILTDIDFCETDLICMRNAQVIGQDGLASNAVTQFRFTGVVTSIRGDVLSRGSDAEFITGSILIVTRTRLLAGKFGFTADIIRRRNRNYTVTDVNNYSQYGRGFVEATCEPLLLAGSANPAPFPLNSEGSECC